VDATAVAIEREFRYTQRDFLRVRRIIHARAGIALGDSKIHMVYSRLVRRLRALGLRSFREYLDRLENAVDAPEWEAFTNALTTNLTSFFREAHHFEVLRGQLARMPAGAHALLWSAAASTGEEAYSMAITAAETFGTLAPPVTILATDIDTAVLDVGAAGIYPLERLERVSHALRRRYFRRGVGANAGHCRVIDELRARVRFQPLNLLESPLEPPLAGDFDAIFCRNVMIYFDKATQHRLVRELLGRLAPDGLLFTGHSESFPALAALMRPCGRTVYRRVGAGQAAA
jgi:chemotaxis protein methyltransferase CheR